MGMPSPAEPAAPALVSVHGGHSGEFCSHARDRLEDVIAAYAQRGFAWVAITEHMPAWRDALVPAEERAAGLDAEAMAERFRRYFARARELEVAWSDRLRVFVGFESEADAGALEAAEAWTRELRPDCVVGSVHSVHDIPIDVSPALFERAVVRAGGLEALYCAYFDLQYEMLERLRPAVVGHFDLVRLLDSGHRDRLALPSVRRRIERNLDCIASQRAILDVNLRAFAKGQSEPFPSRSVLALAHVRGVRVAPGDDSHGMDDVGRDYARGIRMLAELGFPTRWPVPGSD
jgi:histidinol-phosphatase (PHP family)